MEHKLSESGFVKKQDLVLNFISLRANQSFPTLADNYFLTNLFMAFIDIVL